MMGANVLSSPEEDVVRRFWFHPSSDFARKKAAGFVAAASRSHIARFLRLTRNSFRMPASCKRGLEITAQGWSAISTVDSNEMQRDVSKSML